MVASLELVEKEKHAGVEFKNEPPKIIFSETPAVLVTFEGEPKLMKVENTNLMKAVNTPFFVVLDMTSKRYYLKAGEIWMEAKGINGPWQPTAKIPKAAMLLSEQKDASNATGTVNVQEANSTENLTQIITTTELAELIVTNGEPEFQTISGTSLLYVSNSSSDIFLDIDNQQLYILLSGRWFAATSKEGPWSFVYPDKLPTDFANIPPGSEKASVRAHVAGTEEAKEAVTDTLIPQTAAVQRKDASLTVTYDGQPQFKPVEGTSMKYAINTPYSIIYVDNMYYCCHDAVWFSAGSPNGPWTICTEVPQVIYTIPPSCPLYPVRYVYVYDSTPDVVYVGYTSGYLNCYPYYGCVVYGTGYYYTPWCDRFCYPCPLTYGLGFFFNDSFGCWGFDIGFCGRGWFAGGFITGGFFGHCIFDFDDFGLRHRFGERRFEHFGRFDRDRFASVNNIFSARREPFVRTFGRSQTAFRTENRRNNVFSDREGHVFRNTINGWERHNSNGWSRVESANRQRTTETPMRENRTSTIESQTSREREIQSQPREQIQQQTHGQIDGAFEQHHQELNQELRARSRGSERTQSFQQFRGAESRGGGHIDGGGGGGGFHGGGGGGGRGGRGH
jgi:hypothetical protein